jgi:hypothetical protein
MAREGFIYDDGGRRAAGFKGDAGDCVCRAIAIATGKPYREVYDRLAEGNLKQRRTHRSGKSANKRSASDGISTKRLWFKDYMQLELGFRWVPTMKIGSGTTIHLDAAELPKGRLIVVVSKRYTTMIDGVIHDTHDPRREKSWSFQPDHGQELKANQGRNQNGVWTEIGGRAVYGYWVKEERNPE